jgi:hypothetical protein
MAGDPVDEAAARLYGVPFEDFVAERTTEAKALRSAGDRDAAATVAKLPKPSQVAWVANQLSREGADELLEAGEALREAQLGGGGREAVRDAAAAERDAVDALLKRAGELRKLSRDAQDRLRTLLNSIAGDDEVRAAFEAGRLVEEPEPGGGWPGLGGFEAPPANAKSKSSRAPAKPARERSDVRKRREERERKAAERREKEAARKREEAERRKLERRLKAARDRAAAARERLETAREAYESACDEVARIEEQLA